MSGKTVPIHGYGFVTLEDSMGNDLSIVNSARVSFGEQDEDMTPRNAGLINFLMREHHGTPFEAPVFHFMVKAPIFVAREHFRHRIGSFNEWSGRYSELKEEFYVPSPPYVREQKGKPGAYHYESIEDPEVVDNTIYHMERLYAEAYRTYQSLLNNGVAKEVARDVLPVGMYTKYKWTVNLRALMNFLSLRNHKQALWEIQDYAKAIEPLVTEVCPEAMKAFISHGRTCP